MDESAGIFKYTQFVALVKYCTKCLLCRRYFILYAIETSTHSFIRITNKINIDSLKSLLHSPMTPWLSQVDEKVFFMKNVIEVVNFMKGNALKTGTSKITREHMGSLYVNRRLLYTEVRRLTFLI